MDYEMYMDFKAIHAEERKHSFYTGFLDEPEYCRSPRIEMLLNSFTGHEVMILSKTTIASSKSDILEYIQILQRVVEHIPDNTFPWTVPQYGSSYWKTTTPTNDNPPLNQTADNMSNDLYYTGSEEPKVMSDSFAKKLENDLPDKMIVNPSYDDYLLNVTPMKDQDKTCVMCRSTPVNLDSQTGRESQESEHKSDTTEHDNAVEPDYSETQKILSDKQRLSTTNNVNGSNP